MDRHRNRPPEIVSASSSSSPASTRRRSTAAAERYQKLKIWKSSPVIEAKAIDKFQDILVNGNVLEKAKRVKFQDLILDRVRQQGEVIRARHRTNGAAPKVELRGVGLRYFGREGETEALQDISLSVAPGEFVAIIGQSGCGKSTLLSLISGILAADRRRRSWWTAYRSPGRPARSATCCSRITCSSGAPSSITRCSALKSRAPTWARRASARRSS